MINCTVVGNHSMSSGGGVYCYRDTSNINNIIMFNTASNTVSSNVYVSATGFHVMHNCCVAPVLALGNNNFTAEPRFVDTSCHDYRLRAGSPCIEAGWSVFAPQPEDVAGVQRVIGMAVDVGAHEHVPEFVGGGMERYAALDEANVYPYTNLATASRTLQAAVESAGSGGRVLAAPGVYARGYGSHRGLRSRVVAVRPVRIEALNSNTPQDTIILGEADVCGGLGTNGFAMRCVTLTAGVYMCGFTLSNGFTRDAGIPINFVQAGGGALCDRGGTLEHCVVAGNNAGERAGGVMINSDGMVGWSRLQGNRARYGGGVYLGGGGAVRNALIMGNTAAQQGGGLYLDMGGMFESSTIADNTAGVSAGGAYIYSAAQTNLNNVLYENTAPSDANYAFLIGRLGYTCTIPAPDSLYSAGGNITNAPWFVNRAAGDYRMQLRSPTIDAGTNQAWMAGAKDLEGDPRIFNGRVDMGCYEFVPEPGGMGMVGLWLFTIYDLRFTIWRKRRGR